MKNRTTAARSLVQSPDQYSFLTQITRRGVVERDGKFQISGMVWAFVFDFAARESRTLAVFRRSYNATADQTLSPVGFYQRLTPLFAAYLRDLVEH